MHRMAESIFWGGLGLTAYVYFGYPLLVGLFAGWSRKPSPPEPQFPRLTLIIPAHNEEQWMAHKLENTLQLDYPRELLQIVVASDGSTDRTVETARQFAGHGIEVVDFPRRVGKQDMLNSLVPAAEGEILVMTDTHVLLAPSSVRNLVRHFADPQVGCVTGQRMCILQAGVPQGTGEGWYWGYESWIKRHESRLHSCLGAHGQLYAVRRSIFPFVEKVGEDFYIPLKIIADTGLRVLFEPTAVAYTPAAANLHIEFERKTRAHVSFLLTLSLLPGLLLPWRNPVWWQYISHHLLRMAVPVAMTGTLLGSFLLAPHHDYFYRAAAGLQLLFYALAATGFFLARRDSRLKIFYFPFYFVFANLAIARALGRWPRRKYDHAWQRTERIPVSAESLPAKSTSFFL
jgi:cellulose synthase/poly-beta-1,6-N-acetylglucosamine synthase-like glycosyltransferase